MLISLPKQTTTTPRARTDPGAHRACLGVGQRYGATEQTIWKWRKRDSMQVVYSEA